jgi:PAB-dependent poly(A)-specific ribonuclease subunit 2
LRTNPNPIPEPISTFAFDYVQEILWVGSRYGRVLALYGPELQRYVSYVGHRGEAVKQILFHEKGVISLSRRHLHMAQRTGMVIWHLNDPKFHDLQCMTFTKGTNEVVLAGVQDQMFKVDLEKGQVTEYVRMRCVRGSC